jgi:formiminotetrahydrofolate cyclodeaminase
LSPSSERPLADLLAALSARSPAPGAGSAAGWAGALAAALLEMTSAFAEDPATARAAAALREQLLAEAEQELRSYEPVLEALRLPASDPVRGERVASALSEASETPLAIARAAAEVAVQAAEVARESKLALEGDAVAGVLLAEAVTQAAARLVQINLAERQDDPRLEEASELASRALRARESVLR